MKKPYYPMMANTKNVAEPKKDHILRDIFYHFVEFKTFPDNMHFQLLERVRKMRFYRYFYCNFVSLSMIYTPQKLFLKRETNPSRKFGFQKSSTTGFSISSLLVG
jgi:hypothetical protein